jgi:hypothetical protein
MEEGRMMLGKCGNGECCNFLEWELVNGRGGNCCCECEFGDCTARPTQIVISRIASTAATKSCVVFGEE